MEHMWRSSTFPRTPYSMERPRSRLHGITEIRGPYYTVLGEEFLEDIFQSQNHLVDGVKFAGASLCMMPKERVKLLTALAHKHGLYVSTGGWADHVLAKGPRFFHEFVKDCKDHGFDTVDLSNAFLNLQEDDLMRLIRLVTKSGLRAKPEILFKEGQGITNEHGDRDMREDLELLIKRAERCLEAGADMIMIESDGLTGNVHSWRTDVLAEIVGRLGLERTMFEAHEPNVLEWFIKRYGSKVNLYVNYTDAAQLDRLRSGMTQPSLIRYGLSI